MKPVTIRISNGEHHVVITMVWSEDMGCWVGLDESHPETKRAGDTIGEVIDKLSAASENRIQGILEGPG